MLSKILSFLMAGCLLFTGCSVEQPTNLNRYYVEKNVLYNNEQGYSFSIPNGFSLNEEFYPNNLRLESQDTVIEIYSYEAENKDAVASFIGYTNQAITNNSIDYFEVENFNENGATILIWSRDKLDRIENDRNHYLKIDIPNGNTVHTIFAKSNRKIDNYHDYLGRFKSIYKQDIYEPIINVRTHSNREFNEETTKLYNDYFLNSDKLSWGIFHPKYMADESLKEFENKIEHNFEFALWYTGFHKEYNPESMRGFLDKAYADNKIVEMTLQPTLAHEAGNDLFRVLDGYYDDFLDAYVKDIVDFGHPVLFRFANEMNGDWCEYSGYQMSLDTELYREMYKYVYSFFEKYDADNVIWIWNPNGKSFPNFNWNIEDMYYPGDEYVDVLGLTLYNTGNFYEGENWSEFEELYSSLYENSMKKYNMPFMITEFSCARAGGNKEEWTRNMLTKIEDYKNIKVAIWWNGADYTADGEISRAYFIDDSEEMVTIFNEYFNK